MRTLGWTRVSRETYRQCYEHYGGSIATHPDLLDFLHDRLPLEPAYLGLAGPGGELDGAVCRWGSRLAGDERVLRTVVRPAYDLGAPEIVLPCSSAAASRLRLLLLRTSHLSGLNRHLFANLRRIGKERRQLALAKGMGEGGFSVKTKRRRKQDVRRFLATGGHATRVADHDAHTLADIYRDLHRNRWGREPGRREHLIDMLDALRHLLFGHVLWMRGHPVAYDFVLMADGPERVFAECVNGGVDSRYADLSPGSVLIWLNLVEAWERAHAAGKDLRFSMGRMDLEYKRTWCRPAPLYRSITW